MAAACQDQKAGCEGGGSIALLQKRIEELELKLAQRNEELAAECERSAKARKKVRQLLAKISERDEKFAELKSTLDLASVALASAGLELGGEAGVVARSTKTEKTKSKPSKAADAGAAATREKPSRSGRKSEKPSRNGRQSSPEVVAQEREEIVGQLEAHLAQMRRNLAQSEKEVVDLEARRRAKELEWKNTPVSERSVELNQAYSLIQQQVAEKRKFTETLLKKTEALEVQVSQQRAVIDDLQSGDLTPPGVQLSQGFGEVAATAPAEASDDEVFDFKACEDEALQAFLDAAGSISRVILTRPLLRDAFEGRPLELCENSMQGLSATDRVQVLSLFAAWVAVSGAQPSEMKLSDLSLSDEETSEIVNTLESCNAQLCEWEMTRCRLSKAATDQLIKSIALQPLQLLNLGYNALGPFGASSLTAAAASANSWTSSLHHLGLEMNGLGDVGCSQVAEALERGLLPGLEVLELGWNELSSSCASNLASLLRCSSSEGGEEKPKKQHRLSRLGLAGNKLSSEGASTLALAALSQPDRNLELDISMNHVASQILHKLSSWASGQGKNASSGGKKKGVRTSISLEWNVIDDAAAVQNLASCLHESNLEAGADCQPLFRLGNNEVADLNSSEAIKRSRRLLAC
eukprot:TRINITY_DN82472_c0_g1_i1.p1 TRINITY_DN82472_c0_g1~~TRINITY_DN82472_c0_g1_i1.p1  ORF type:complete len:663 (-),score=152.91 TRINITY_DN82472_c0_g1_i1:236-2146(-)